MEDLKIKSKRFSENQFGFRKGKGTRDAIGMIRRSQKEFKIQKKKSLSHLLIGKKRLIE